MPHELFLTKSEVLSWVKNFKFSNHLVNNKQTIRFIDLFAGCGGMSYGVVAASNSLGMSAFCCLALDHNSDALNVYADNIPLEQNAILPGDIEDLLETDLSKPITKNEQSLSQRLGNVDIMVAGPPCQGHSDLNNSTRRNDPRNNLYKSCIRAVMVLRPAHVVIENVPNVIHSSEKVTQSAESMLQELGYSVKAVNVSFLDLGLPQSRKRHVLVASLDHQKIASLAKVESHQESATLGEFFEGLEFDNDMVIGKSGKLSNDNLKRVEFLFKNDIYNLPNELRPPCHRDKEHSYNSVYGRLSNELPAQTLTSGYGSMGQGRYIHPTEPRTINSKEAARIQGFPDSFDFSACRKVTQLRKMIANAVPPQLMMSLTKHFIS
jgi:DNA (cytosine-5)-methyltransferase 1